MPRNRCLISLLSMLIAAGSWVAGEATSLAEDADALIQRGIELRKKGQDDAALTAFRSAYALAKTPRAAAQLGFAEQALGEWADAQKHIEEALSSPSDPWIAKNRETIDGSLRTIQDHTARIDIRGGVDGAEVEVNGRSVGKLPLAESVWVSAGAVDVTVRAPSYRPALRSVVVAPRSRTKVHFTLEALATGGDAPRVEVELSTSTSAAPDGSRGLRIAGLATGAGGAALLGVGVFCSLTGKSKLDSLKADADAGRPYDEANGNWKTFQNAAVVFYAAGGAAIAGGALMYYFGRRPSGTDGSGASTALYLAPTTTGAILGGVF